MVTEYICRNGHYFVFDMETLTCPHCQSRLAYWAPVDAMGTDFRVPSLGFASKRLISERELEKRDYKGNVYFVKESVWFPDSSDWREVEYRK